MKKIVDTSWLQVDEANRSKRVFYLLVKIDFNRPRYVEPSNLINTEEEAAGFAYNIGSEIMKRGKNNTISNTLKIGQILSIFSSVRE